MIKVPLNLSQISQLDERDNRCFNSLNVVSQSCIKNLTVENNEAYKEAQHTVLRLIRMIVGRPLLRLPLKSS